MNGLASNEIIFDPLLPWSLIVLLAGALLLFTARVYWRTGSSLGAWQKSLLLILRLGGLALVVLLLLQPSRRETVAPPPKDRITLVALDTSLSMKQRDAGTESRFDAAKNLLLDSGVAARNGVVLNPRLRLFQFGDDAQPVTGSILDLAPKAKTTRINKSIDTILRAPAADAAVNAIILLTDGHDFELVNPVKTGAAAKARQAPIYAVALGKQGKVRDVATRITSYQPYCYVKQKARIGATLRLIGCELEDITVQLLRQGQVVQTKKINAGEAQELPVDFEVTEAEAGQYEYEVRALPLPDEVDNNNNSAMTYLNVIDQQIKALILEGDPYWDTTFLERSLNRNDKFEVDTLARYGEGKVRAIRKTGKTGDLQVPSTLEQFCAYDVVILGRGLDKVLSPAQIDLLTQFVKERAGAVIFARGRAFGSSTAANELEPVIWGDKSRDRVKLEVAADGRGVSAFHGLADGETGLDTLPELINGKPATELQPLTSTLAAATAREDSVPAPAIVHRRFGLGQVVSVGVDGLWRWGLNPKVEGVNSPFDRFWDQMILWLLAGRDIIPSRQYSFRPNSANILLGEKAHFRLTLRDPNPSLKSVPVTFYYGDAEVGRANLTQNAADFGRLGADFLPEKVGRYRAAAQMPDGTTQESRFIVYTENLEETEVAVDTVYLRRLCESSGGRVIEAAELPRLLNELSSEPSDQAPKTRLRPVWDQAWVFYATGVLFGLDWFLRRRWGLC